jgi:hypothetical protein
MQIGYRFIPQLTPERVVCQTLDRLSQTGGIAALERLQDACMQSPSPLL